MSDKAPSPIIPTQHYVSATGVVTGTPDAVFAKLEVIIAERFPGKMFRIVGTNTTTFRDGRNWTVSAVIEEQA